MEELLLPLVYWFGLVVAFAGLVGYSSLPSYEFDRHERYVRAIAAFYLVATFCFLLHAVSHVFRPICVYIELFVVLALFAASLYLMLDTGVERFDARRFKDALLYGAVAWLMGRHMTFVEEYPVEASVIMACLSFPVFAVSAYLFYSIRKKAIYFNFEEHRVIISSSFFIVYLTGLGSMSLDFPSVHYALELVSSGILLFVLYRMWKVARVFINA
ncbi:hypothetical protein [Archaeoglobus veneficus]|uniref:Uncharacterized protein n=1 Tax=Archaeoglobus veneficus (strain DSM 11195 / SNP6) TaxID=693661 RepID=F2KSE9_ARCVS|nr:hypothetical protein [Archaeoglobus veneficus]AEA46918.1 hypothetical protein Arcve_0907 [Archaeoglobus veneficus SNP6]